MCISFIFCIFISRSLSLSWAESSNHCARVPLRFSTLAFLLDPPTPVCLLAPMPARSRLVATCLPVVSMPPPTVVPTGASPTIWDRRLLSSGSSTGNDPLLPLASTAPSPTARLALMAFLASPTRILYSRAASCASLVPRSSKQAGKSCTPSCTKACSKGRRSSRAVSVLSLMSLKGLMSNVFRGNICELSGLSSMSTILFTSRFI